MAIQFKTGDEPNFNLYTRLKLDGFYFNVELYGHALQKYLQRTSFSGESREQVAEKVCSSLTRASLSDFLVNEIPVDKTASCLVLDCRNKLAYALSINGMRYAMKVKTVFTFYKAVFFYDAGDICIVVEKDGTARFATKADTRFCPKNL